MPNAFRAALAAAVVCLTCAAGAQALPKYAQKEKKSCGYCHVNPAGGGKRNAAGYWYAAHKLSFKGYTPAKAAAAFKAKDKKPAGKTPPKKGKKS